MSGVGHRRQGMVSPSRTLAQQPVVHEQVSLVHGAPVLRGGRADDRRSVRPGHRAGHRRPVRCCRRRGRVEGRAVLEVDPVDPVAASHPRQASDWATASSAGTVRVFSAMTTASVSGADVRCRARRRAGPRSSPPRRSAAATSVPPVKSSAMQPSRDHRGSRLEDGRASWSAARCGGLSTGTSSAPLRRAGAGRERVLGEHDHVDVIAQVACRGGEQPAQLVACRPPPTAASAPGDDDARRPRRPALPQRAPPRGAPALSCAAGPSEARIVDPVRCEPDDLVEHRLVGGQHRHRLRRGGVRRPGRTSSRRAGRRPPRRRRRTR